MRIMGVVCLCAMLFSLPGCHSRDILVSIKPGLTAYAPPMSLVPGMPLSAEMAGDHGDLSRYRFHWVAEQGIFNTWDQDTGIVTVMGGDIQTDEGTVYWSPAPDEAIRAEYIRVHLAIVDSFFSAIVCETTMEIAQDEEGVFSIKD